MNVFLLGNGFDLHYYLPTSYHNFLNTVDFLCKHNTSEMRTIGDVFRSLLINYEDSIIRESYKRYKNGYDKIELSQEDLQAIINTATNNKWFRYFVELKMSGDGWIDFENEIKSALFMVDQLSAIAVSYIQYHDETDAVIPKASIEYCEGIMRIIYSFGLAEAFEGDFSYPYYDQRQRFILAFGKETKHVVFQNRYLSQVVDHPLVIKLNKNAVKSDLLQSLKEFAQLLIEYLQLFVEKPLCLLVQEGLIPQDRAFTNARMIVSLNYTKTFETLYGEGERDIFHIHGSTDTSIVLGTHADKNDEIEQIDTSFIEFKKYYQRVINHTDSKYLEYIKDLRSYVDLPETAKNAIMLKSGDMETSLSRMAKIVGFGTINLYVFGHSLDITDKEVIQELFELANRIVVFFHQPHDMEGYVKRLVTIFGKNQFDNLRKNKGLIFVSSKDLNKSIVNRT